MFEVDRKPCQTKDYDAYILLKPTSFPFRIYYGPFFSASNNLRWSALTTTRNEENKETKRVRGRGRGRSKNENESSEHNTHTHIHCAWFFLFLQDFILISSVKYNSIRNGKNYDSLASTRSIIIYYVISTLYRFPFCLVFSFVL